MIKHIRFLSFVGAAFLMFAGSAFAAGKPILIGTSVSLSGSYAASAKYGLEGYQLFVEQLNKRGGLLGRPVKLIYYDDRSDANTGVQLYEKLITADKVDLIVGPYSSGVTSAVSTVAEKHKMAMIGPEAADVKIYMRGYKYNFQGQTQAGRYMVGALSLAKANGYKTLAMLAEDTAFPKAVSSEVAKVAKEYGLTIVFNQTYPKGAADFSALLTKVKQLNPDVLFANSYLPDGQGIIRQCREQGVDVKLFAVAVGAAEPEFGNLGATANYVFGATQWAANMKTKGNAAFVKSYKEMFGRNPDYHSAANFAALEVLEAAVKAAGSIDQDKIGAAISKTDMDTVYGHFKVDAKGVQVGYASSLLQWQKGKQVVVWPQAVSEGKAILPTPPWSRRK
ncbi:MAG: amino acid ABC transporter substrate-binding protein [Desulfobacteria bacterium]